MLCLVERFRGSFDGRGVGKGWWIFRVVRSSDLGVFVPNLVCLVDVERLSLIG